MSQQSKPLNVMFFFVTWTCISLAVVTRCLLGILIVLDMQADVQGPGWGRSDWNARELCPLIQHFSLLDAYRLLNGSSFVWTQRVV